MTGKVYRVSIGDELYDLMGAFTGASVQDWEALVAATGRNPFTVAQGLRELEKLAAADPFDALQGEAGAVLTRTVGDLVFLARRAAGEQITPQESFATTPLMAALGAFAAAAQLAEAEGGEAPDPT